MTACIGWDGPCPDHGQFHGCTIDANQPHPHRKHRCTCGATARKGNTERAHAERQGDLP